MIDQIFDIAALWLFFGVALAGMLIGAIVGAVKREDARALKRAFEAGILAFVGGLLARTLIALLLEWGDNTPEAGLAVGWAFFLWPGAIDTIALLADEQLLTTPENLLWIASGVGALTGMMNGIWRIHDWKGLGWLSFPLDVTWGLAGTTNACLLHLINFAWGDHADEPGRGAHRYASGFGLKPRYAFTQGSVMSNLSDGPTTGLYSHERTHVWQNRIFGPLFVLSYLGWMAVWVIPGMIAGAIVKAGPFQGAEKWCYFNNPWEAWGYVVQNVDRANVGGGTPEQRRLIWPALFVILWAIPFFGAATLLFVLVLVSVWG